MNKRSVRVSRAASDFPESANRLKNLPKLPLVKAREYGVWHVDAAELEAKVFGTEGNRGGFDGAEKRSELVRRKKELGERLLAQYTQDYESSKGRDGETKMLIKTQRSGTAADKVAAFRVTVEDNPIANMRSLESLLQMVTAKVGKRHALNAFETLKELFLSLLPDRKLKDLSQRPVKHLPESRDGYSLLLFWYWEDYLKGWYKKFISALDEASGDALPALKDKAMKVMYTLLKGKPEQERKLLSSLVNKLGDPENKAASSADFLLTNLLSEHPNMKAVVIGEVDSFLFRPHLELQAKYYAVNFLSKFRLSHKGDGPRVAKRLIDVYFAVFKELMSLADGEQKTDKSLKEVKGKALSSFNKKKTKSSSEHFEKESRILSAVLTGVNRAFPFVSNDEADDLIEVQTPTLFQLVHSKNFNVGVQALMLLDKISSKNQIVSDRYFRALYAKLLLPAALNSSKAEMFFGLLLRAMKSDVNLKRVCAFSKRLLQVALLQPPQYACGCLFLLSEVLKARPPLWNMVLQNESVDDDLEHFKDVVDETENESNTTSMKQENAIKVVNSADSIEPVSGSSQDEDDSPDITSSPSSDDDLSDEAEEDFIVGKDLKSLEKSSTLSKQDRHQPLGSIMRSFLPGGFNPRDREPSHCNADRVSWWELEVLASHVHPSVATMAKTLLSGANIVYYGNPLNDLSLAAFLDKFMEKKPKQGTWHGGSQIEPAKKLDMSNHLLGGEIVSLAEADVAPEDLVFHKFYINKMGSSKKPKKKKKKKKAAVEEAAEEIYDVDGGDESDNDEIENMLDSANLAVEGDGEYDYDDLDLVANEDDDSLVDASDAETDILPDIAGEEDDEEDDTHGGIDVGDVDEDGNGEDTSSQSKRKRKSRGKKGASPFASLEEFEHLLNEDDPATEEPKKKKKQSKSKKKRRSSE